MKKTARRTVKIDSCVSGFRTSEGRKKYPSLMYSSTMSPTIPRKIHMIALERNAFLISSIFEGFSGTNPHSLSI